MLFTLIAYVCATAQPCKVEEAEARIQAKHLSVEECANRGPTAAMLFSGEDKYLIVLCRLDPDARKA